ncbi:hypothetical protein EV360DRAFT_75829 [Lentinula raphanica]|nr:hypothetical protein EV360DRAFT_75829 [Lentinula raphanica]
MTRPNRHTHSKSRSSSPSSTSSSPQPGCSPSAENVKNAKLKRKLDMLEQELNEVKGRKKKGSSSPQILGRGINRMASLFVSVKTLVRESFDYMDEEVHPTAFNEWTAQQKEEYEQQRHDLEECASNRELALEELFAYCDQLCA